MDPRGDLVYLGLPLGAPASYWPHWSWAECRLEVALAELGKQRPGAKGDNQHPSGGTQLAPLVLK